MKTFTGAMKRVAAILFPILMLPAYGQGTILSGGKAPDPVELKRVYDHYTSRGFSEVAAELAKSAGENSLMLSMTTEEEWQQPWTHSLALTLHKAWYFHLDSLDEGDPQGEKTGILMTLLENPAIGEGRKSAMAGIAQGFLYKRHLTCREVNSPLQEKTLRQLDAIATNKGEDPELRLEAVKILYEYRDSNDYLDLVIELTSHEKTPLAMAEKFRFATPVTTYGNSYGLTKENRAKYLNHAYGLLESIDDKKSGVGYFLASDIGHFIGIKPVRPGQGAFAPDQRLEEYQGKQGLTESFFQKTVDNAMEWWAQHKADYLMPQDATR